MNPHNCKLYKYVFIHLIYVGFINDKLKFQVRTLSYWVRNLRKISTPYQTGQLYWVLICNFFREVYFYDLFKKLLVQKTGLFLFVKET